MIRTKKSQTTIFIIIGLIMLIAIVFFINIRKDSQRIDETSVIKKISETPVMFQPINDFVESCISKIGKEGIMQIGIHGGYTDLRRYGITANPAKPTDMGAFLFSPENLESGVAYWQYFKSNNKCEVGCECASNMPFLYKEQGSPSIEKQLEDYMNKNLNSCLDNLNIFKSQGFKIDAKGSVKTTTNIRDSDVFFHVNFPVTAIKDDSEFELEEYISTLQVDLKNIYKFADAIKETEKDSTFMERWTLEELAGFGLGINKDRLPPMAASTLDPGSKSVYWIKKQVEDNIMNNILPLYTPFFTVFGSKNYNPDLIGTFYEKAILPIGDPANFTYQNLEVKFSYLDWWPVYFDITGRGVSGQRIGPDTMSSSFFADIIGIKRYNLYYDLSYPVLIDIYDEKAFNGEGFHFYFGLETNVRNNRPLNCSGPGLTQYAATVGSLFCDYEQGCANITIETIDMRTGNALEDVNVYYSSGNENCDKGLSKISNNNAILKTTLPQCVGSACSLNAVKSGYFSYPKTYAVRCGKRTGICGNDNILCNDEKLTIGMEPFRDINITIMKKKMIKTGEKSWELSNQVEKLLDNEYAVISLEKIKQDPQEEDMVLAAVIYGNDSPTSFYPGLVPGEYKLTIDLFYEFPDSKKRKDVTFKMVIEEGNDGFLGIGSTDDIIIGPYTFNETFIEGEFTGNITLTKAMLDNFETIEFYALASPDIDSSYNVLDAYDLEEMGNSEKYSKKYKVELKPTVR